jgi:hypothetical protein
MPSLVFENLEFVAAAALASYPRRRQLCLLTSESIRDKNQCR